jgi:hypothetical protein
MSAADGFDSDRSRLETCVASVSASLLNGRSGIDVLPSSINVLPSSGNAYRTPPNGLGNAFNNRRIPKNNDWMFSKKDMFRMWLRGFGFLGGGGVILVRTFDGSFERCATKVQQRQHHALVYLLYLHALNSLSRSRIVTSLFFKGVVIQP